MRHRLQVLVAGHPEIAQEPGEQRGDSRARVHRHRHQGLRTGDLAAQLGGATVAVAPLANFAPTYRVSLRVQRFESALNESVLVEAVWVVRKEPNGAAQSGHTLARETVSGSGFDALTAAHSRALATISADIAAAIRAPAT